MVEYEDNWRLLKSTLQRELRQQSPAVMISTLSDIVEDLVKNGHGERLYNDMKEVLTQHAESQVSQS
jgi:hypothetical protein